MWALLLLLMCSAGWCSDIFPNPHKEWRKCGRPKSSFVCDPDFILERGDAEKLDQIAEEFQKSTSCVCSSCANNIGITVGIMLKNNISEELLLEHPGNEGVAQMIRKKWRLINCESDIIILLLTKQNITQFSMGPPVQHIFPKEVALRIIQECWVHIQSGYYYQGLESIVNSFNDVLVQLQKEESYDNFRNIIIGIALGLALLLFLVLFAFTVLHRQAKRRKSHCSTIYDPPIIKKNRRPSFNSEQHLEILRKLNVIEDEDDDDVFLDHQQTFKLMRHSAAIQSVRFNRQLSDVTEESNEDIEMVKRNSNEHPPTILPKSRDDNLSIPVTEL